MDNGACRWMVLFLAAGERRDIRFETPAQVLTRGRYFVSFSVYDVDRYGSSAGQEARYDVLAHALDFEVASPDGDDDFLIRHPLQVSLARPARH